MSSYLFEPAQMGDFPVETCDPTLEDEPALTGSNSEMQERLLAAQTGRGATELPQHGLSNSEMQTALQEASGQLSGADHLDYIGDLSASPPGINVCDPSEIVPHGQPLPDCTTGGGATLAQSADPLAELRHSANALAELPNRGWEALKALGRETSISLDAIGDALDYVGKEGGGIDTVERWLLSAPPSSSSPSGGPGSDEDTPERFVFRSGMELLKLVAMGAGASSKMAAHPVDSVSAAGSAVYEAARHVPVSGGNPIRLIECHQELSARRTVTDLRGDRDPLEPVDPRRAMEDVFNCVERGSEQEDVAYWKDVGWGALAPTYDAWMKGEYDKLAAQGVLAGTSAAKAITSLRGMTSGRARTNTVMSQSHHNGSDVGLGSQARELPEGETSRGLPDQDHPDGESTTRPRIPTPELSEYYKNKDFSVVVPKERSAHRGIGEIQEEMEFMDVLQRESKAQKLDQLDQAYKTGWGAAIKSPVTRNEIDYMFLRGKDWAYNKLGRPLKPSDQRRMEKLKNELPAHTTTHLDNVSRQKLGGFPDDGTPEQAADLARGSARHEILGSQVKHHEHDMLLAEDERDAGKIVSSLKASAEQKGIPLEERVDGDVVTLYARVDGEVTEVGSVRKGAAQYQPVDEATPGKNRIYRKAGTDEEFVQDAAGVYTPRYVYRYLNQHDDPANRSIKVSPSQVADSGKTWSQVADEIAQAAAQGNLGPLYEEFYAHARMKEAQGGSPIVSTTASRRAIMGSTGQDFKEGNKGVVKIDLSLVDQGRIVNGFDPAARARITGVEKPDPYMEGTPVAKTGASESMADLQRVRAEVRDSPTENNAGARDLFRTEEVGIVGDIPPEALVEYTKGGRTFVTGRDGAWTERESSPAP